MSLKDKILRREELKERISFLEDKVESLEKEKEELKAKADKEEERAKDAVSEKQELDRNLKKKEDKIDSLQDKLRKKEFIDDKTSDVSSKEKISREELRSLLNKLGSVESNDEDMVSVFLSEDSSVKDINSQGFLQTNLTLNQLRRLKEESSVTGEAFFHTENLLNTLIKPPVPVGKEDWEKASSFQVEPLLDRLDEEVGFVFLSAGGSAAALFSEEIEDFEMVKSEIKGKHKKGGFSQDRFERGREKEVKEHIEEVEEACEEVIPEDVDLLCISGSPQILSEFKETIFDGKGVFERKLDVSSIEDKEELERAFHKFWRADVIHL